MFKFSFYKKANRSSVNKIGLFINYEKTNPLLYNILQKKNLPITPNQKFKGSIVQNVNGINASCGCGKN
jgi:hypothetical protein